MDEFCRVRKRDDIRLRRRMREGRCTIILKGFLINA